MGSGFMVTKASRNDAEVKGIHELKFGSRFARIARSELH